MPTPPDDLLDPYFAGELSSERAAEVRAYLEANPGRRGVILGIFAAARADDIPARPPVEAAEGRLMARVDELQLPAGAGTRRLIGREWRGRVLLRKQSLRGSGLTDRKWWGISVFGFCVAGLGLLALGHKTGPFALSPSSVQRTYHAAAGRLATTVTLADHSRAILAPGTVLTVTVGDVTALHVHVMLHGEALFTVRHRPNASFTVQAGHTKVRVLGTSFAVRRFAQDHQTRVVVTAGRVAIQSDRTEQGTGTSVVVAAGGLAQVSDSGVVHMTSGISVDNYTAWTDGTLVFQDTPVREILMDLGRVYGVEFRVADSAIAMRRLSWTLQTAQHPLADVLHDLPLVLDVHLVVRNTASGDVITLVPGRRNDRGPVVRPHSFTPESNYGR